MVVCGRSYVSGSAFKLVNKRAYHHGTMLIDAKLGERELILNPSTQMSLRSLTYAARSKFCNPRTTSSAFVLRSNSVRGTKTQ